MDKLNPKQKLVVYGIILLWLIITFFLVKDATKGHKVIGWENRVVQHGDTLFEITGEYPHKDILELIYKIEKENSTTCILQEGQKLKIPILEVR